MDQQLSEFLRTRAKRIDGASISLTTLYREFADSLTPEHQVTWNRSRFKTELSERFPIGVFDHRTLSAGNIALRNRRFKRIGASLVLTSNG